MDVATAKTLVSLAVVIAIAIFSYVSLEMFVAQVVRDLRKSWANRTAPAVDGDPAPSDR